MATAERPGAKRLLPANAGSDKLASEGALLPTDTVHAVDASEFVDIASYRCPLIFEMPSIRKSTTHDPVDFSRVFHDIAEFVLTCPGMSIVRLTSQPLERLIHALDGASQFVASVKVLLDSRLVSMAEGVAVPLGPVYESSDFPSLLANRMAAGVSLRVCGYWQTECGANGGGGNRESDFLASHH